MVLLSAAGRVLGSHLSDRKLTHVSSGGLPCAEGAGSFIARGSRSKLPNLADENSRKAFIFRLFINWSGGHIAALPASALTLPLWAFHKDPCGCPPPTHTHTIKGKLLLPTP